MRPLPSLAVTALISAVTFVTGVSTAAAADEKPAPREVVKGPAVDADASAAAARIDAEGSALGSYWDPERSELAVVVGPDSNIGEAEAKRLVGGSFRLERLDIAKKTADAVREDIAGSLAGEKYSLASHLDLQTGRVVLETDAPASETERLVKEHPEIELRESKPTTDVFHRRDDIPVLLGRRVDPQRRHVLDRLHRPQALGRPLHHDRRALLLSRLDRSHPDPHVRRHRRAARHAQLALLLGQP